MKISEIITAIKDQNWDAIVAAVIAFFNELFDFVEEKIGLTEASAE